MNYQQAKALFQKILETAKNNFQNCDNLDPVRAARTEGKFTGLCEALRELGMDLEYGAWMDNKCLRVGFLAVDHKEIITNGIIQQEAVKELFEKIIPPTKISVYQINDERDSYQVRFINLKHLEQLQGTPEVDSRIYDKVYSGQLHCESLEHIYKILNTQLPEDYHGSSLSVSDVVEIVESPFIKPGTYFCDSFCFQEIPFELNRTQEAPSFHPEAELADSDRKYVVFIEPEKEPQILEMGTDLRSLQKAVDGYIECVYPFDSPVGVIVNEDGKLQNMPFNRALRDDKGYVYDITAGPMVLVGLGEEDFCQLTKAEAQKYAEIFQSPERFEYIGGQIVVSKIPPKAMTMEEEIASARERAQAMQSPVLNKNIGKEPER